MKVVVVYNPKSGSSLSEDELMHLFHKANIEVEKVIPVGGGYEKILQPFIDTGKCIAVVGGDGTVSNVATLLVHTKAVLIPLPGGTLNHFAKDLGAPSSLPEAIKKLAKATQKKVDVAKVNDIIFLNNSSIGLYPASLTTRKMFEDNIGKWPAAAFASLKALVRFRTYRVEINGRTYKSPFIFIGNNRYVTTKIGGVERKKISEGVLTVFIAHTTSRRELIWIMAQILVGRSAYNNHFYDFYPTSIHIKTTHSQVAISYDGEVKRITTPLNYVVLPKALNVLI